MVFINEKPLLDLIFKMNQNGLKMIGKPLLEPRKAYFGSLGLFSVKNATNNIDSPMTKSGQGEIWGPKLKLKHVRLGLLLRIEKFRRISTVHLRNIHGQFS